MICVFDWIVFAVGKHVVAQQALAGTGVGIGVDKPAPFGVVITALEVIQAGISDISVASEPIWFSIHRLKSHRKCPRTTECRTELPYVDGKKLPSTLVNVKHHFLHPGALFHVRHCKLVF